ncbi:TonB-dependent receptor [Dysgonomonas sp. 521]|uniref:SusC/RagA family TonB-linked outer membrane protein n=1 Tax=Dysgonomonas sp. 521 TaxID=2302932 RepID=UPI0013D627EE|nr:TonB-dependent receptor [Dysgonomonas sp. 521]NDV94791.1 TonB-dependent receptor [Dysgonomonas sp. 521]
MKNIQVLHEKSWKEINRCLKLIILFLLISVPCAYAESNGINEAKQERLITGTVTDDTGEALIGVSISIKGTTTGTLTDLDGKYSLSVPNSSAILVFTYVGYDTQEFTVGNQSNISVVLKNKDAYLEEVVVVGYGVQKKKLITGATVQVSGDDIAKQSTVSPFTALQAQTPGVNITQGSGMPGENFIVNIRGKGTMGDSAPLYVVDGITGDIGLFNSLNPSDIESVDVLKDAASSAIYGSRAANGVILVTTKKGKAGKVQLTYDGWVGWQNAYRMPALLNAKEYMTIVNESYFNTGGSGAMLDFEKLIPAQYQSIMDGTWNGTNWLEEIRNKNALTQNHSIGLTGGTDMSKFSMGFSYTSQDGIFGKPANPEYTRSNARINSEHVLLKGNGFDAIKIGENVNYTYSTKSGVGITNIYWNDVHNMVGACPLLPIYDSNGNYYDKADKDADGWALQGAIANPVAQMLYSRGMNMSRNHNLNMNAYLEIQPIKNLIFRSSFGYKMSSYNYRSYQPKYTLSNTVSNAYDSNSQSAGMGYSISLDNTVSYSLDVNQVHHFDAVLGQSIEKDGTGESVGATNFVSQFPGSWDNAYLDNMKGEPGVTVVTATGSPWGEGRLVSFFGRVNYNYQEKYMATVILRADASSNFARGNRWGYFPSVSAGWVVTNESFMESSRSWMDFLKLRGSWGQNGNNRINAFQYLATIAADKHNGYYFGNDMKSLVQGSYPYVLPNPDITWETTEQLDFGIDARFLNARLGLIFDWYKKTTKDWLVTVPVPAMLGLAEKTINGGDIVNQGFELGLNWNDRINDFTYGANFNLSHNKNEVTRIDNSEGIIHGDENVLSQGTGEMYRAQVGFPLGYFYGYKTAGVFQNAEQLAATPAKLAGSQPGDLIFVDDNNDGSITAEDKTMIGNPNPKFTVGLSLNFGYKGFDLSIAAAGKLGFQIAKSYRSFADSPLNNYTTEIFDRWHGEGTSNRLPRLTTGSDPNWQNISDIYIEDGDFIKLQNLTIGYDFKRLFPAMPLSQARLYFTAQNLFTITGYSGLDPEIGYGDSKSWASNIDVGFYPSPRTYLVGVNLKF